MFSAPLFGQAVRSPFSTYGIGDIYGDYLIQNQGMGGMGVSQPQYWYINNQNPALLVYNLNTVFQAGLVGESKKVIGADGNEKGLGGNLNYLATAFPVKPITRNPYRTRWSTAVGLMPYSTVNYNLAYIERAIDGAGDLQDSVAIIESGSGGLNQFYWSNGVTIAKNLSVGIKAAYVFGPLETSYQNQFINRDTQAPNFFTEVKEKTSVKDFKFTFGISYGDTLRKNYGYQIGATYSPVARLNASRRAEVLRFIPGRPVAIEGDTLFSRGGSMRIPGSLTVGVSYYRINRWLIGTEFNYQDWSTFESVVQDDEGLGENWRVALGGELTPDPYDDNLLKRMTYRLGVNYEKYPFIVNGNQVNDFGINFGFSIPANRSSLDMAFKVGKRGDRGENIFEETYFKVYFGVTFNDKWFIQRKFD